MAARGGDQALANVKEPNTASLACPMLSKTNYTIWAMRMKAIFNVHAVWDQIETGNELEAKKNNMAIALLFQSIPEDQILQVGNLPTAKEMWDALKTRNLGADRVREARLQTLMSEFENLKMKDQGTVDEFSSTLSGYASKAASLGSVINENKLVKKFLNGLPRKFIFIVASIEQMVDLNTINFDDVVGRLKAYEERIKNEKDPVDDSHQLMFANGDPTSHHKPYDTNSGWRGRGGSRYRGRGRGRGTGQRREPVPDRNNGQGQSNKNPTQKNTEGRQKEKKDKSQIQCFRCDKLGHYAPCCPERQRKDRKSVV